MDTKKVVGIEINTNYMCTFSHSCHHKCVIHYDDNTNEKILLDGVTIAHKYYNYLNDVDKEHFNEYINYHL